MWAWFPPTLPSHLPKPPPRLGLPPPPCVPLAKKELWNSHRRVPMHRGGVERVDVCGRLRSSENPPEKSAGKSSPEKTAANSGRRRWSPETTAGGHRRRRGDTPLPDGGWPSPWPRRPPTSPTLCPPRRPLVCPRPPPRPGLPPPP
jgi:hypothetical protein